jgi:hypothetical protein
VDVVTANAFCEGGNEGGSVEEGWFFFRNL